ncbi:uncharacterized protein F4812DRAFT_460941 [Daldinia caldariorum]|uniref:uncharacterized protein n=1 Tax=Daldinia caldariorum TaxID=326644 RepID=UPI002008D157|nr:uncharacterized protein F4812DRAFT_460941 [Daldinia caldariorum]KAI1465962.1 hypothetical protein F4812DRAFT_460941 [Daldinia caldariorum]
MNAPRGPQRGNKITDSPTKRKRADSELAAPNKKAKLEATLNLSSSSSSEEDVKMLQALESKYDVRVHSIISSSKIQKKVASILQHLTDHAAGKTKTETETETGRGSGVVVLRAKAPDTGKLVSIAEIAKRELGKRHGDARVTWFQYIALSEELKERPRNDGNTIIEETKLGGTGAGGDGNDDDFEIMKTPFERAIEGQPRWRGIPVMSLFLSPVPIEELKKRYGEQTNAASK